VPPGCPRQGRGEHHDGVLSGEFDLGARDDLRAALLGAVTDGTGGHVVVDLADADFIDSETIRVLLDGYTTAQREQVSFRLANPQGVVKRVLDVTGLTEVFSIVA
jgi:anti-sigma B factor antagonist